MPEQLLSTKGQFNDNKLSQDDYEDNSIIIRQALESLQMSYDLFKDYKTGLPNETNKCWRKQVIELIEQANNLASFAVQNGLVAVPKTDQFPSRMLGNIKVNFNKMGGVTFDEYEEDDSDNFQWVKI